MSYRKLALGMHAYAETAEIVDVMKTLENAEIIMETEKNVEINIENRLSSIKFDAESSDRELQRHLVARHSAVFASHTVAS